MRPSFPGKTNFVIHEGRDRRGDSVVYLIPRLPGRTSSEKNLHQYRHRSARGAGKAGGEAGRHSATIYRYTRLIISGSYLGILARDKSLNGRIPAKRDGTRNGQYVWNITASMKISRDKSGCALFRDLRVANSRISKSMRRRESS